MTLILRNTLLLLLVLVFTEAKSSGVPFEAFLNNTCEWQVQGPSEPDASTFEFYRILYLEAQKTDDLKLGYFSLVGMMRAKRKDLKLSFLASRGLKVLQEQLRFPYIDNLVGDPEEKAVAKRFLYRRLRGLASLLNLNAFALSQERGGEKRKTSAKTADFVWRWAKDTFFTVFGGALLRPIRNESRMYLYNRSRKDFNRLLLGQNKKIPDPWKVLDVDQFDEFNTKVAKLFVDSNPHFSHKYANRGLLFKSFSYLLWWPTWKLFNQKLRSKNRVINGASVLRPLVITSLLFAFSWHPIMLADSYLSGSHHLPSLSESLPVPITEKKIALIYDQRSTIMPSELFEGIGDSPSPLNFGEMYPDIAALEAGAQSFNKSLAASAKDLSTDLKRFGPQTEVFVILGRGSEEAYSFSGEVLPSGVKFKAGTRLIFFSTGPLDKGEEAQSWQDGIRALVGSQPNVEALLLREPVKLQAGESAPEGGTSNALSALFEGAQHQFTLLNQYVIASKWWNSDFPAEINEASGALLFKNGKFTEFKYE